MYPHIPSPWEDTKVLEQFISEISNFSSRSVDLGPIASVILAQFLTGRAFSTYQIQKKLNENKEYNFKIAYKDVHKRVQRLDSLGLIKRVPKNQIEWEMTLHAPIFYRITLGGIFNLFYKRESLMFGLGRWNIFEHNGDNIIFKTFVYPYFEKSTLIGIKGSFLPEIIFNYISKCCKLIDEGIEGLAKSDSPRVELIPLFKWNEVPGEHDIEVVRIIAVEFGIDFSGESIIEKYNDNKIRISDKKHSIIIKTSNKKRSATLTDDNGTSHELAIEELGDELILNKVGTFRADIALPTISYRMRYNLLTLAFSILMGVRMGGSENDFVEARIGIDKEDFNIILRDRKATHLLDETHDLFAERYKAFAKLKEMYDNT